MRSKAEVEALARDTPGHGIDHVCVMTPHLEDTLTGAFEDDELSQEERGQGFHRQLSYIQCECGERFGERTWQSFGEHLEDQL